ncbi:MAG: hypothetical protein Q7U60_02520 [Candidatus Methanoperedens sp.]|nr:hypothetical protein [Candidatus Methanoperedens sp.]
MNLKCARCEQEAEYLIKGTSYCKEHLPTDYKSKEISNEYREQLESRVDQAIKDGCSIDFDKYEQYQIKYIQKYAEIELSHLAVFHATLILLIAVGVSYVVTYATGTDFISNIYKNSGLIVLFVGGYLFLYNWLPRYKKCKKVILDVEWQIQTPSEDKEKE